MTDLVNLSETTVTKAGNGFCVALRDGRLPLDGDHPLGLYLNDCRHLRGHELWLGGRAPRLLISSDASGEAAVYELTNPDILLADGRELPLQSLRVRVERMMQPDAMVERITVRSHAREAFQLQLVLGLDCDFRSMLEIREIVAAVEREVRRTASGDTLSFAALGVDGRERSTTVTCEGAVAGDDGRFRTPVSLEPGEELSLELRFALSQPELHAPPEPPGPDGKADGRGTLSRACADADGWLRGHPTAEVDDALVDRALQRSLLDLRLLGSEMGGWRYHAAGVPWYATLFGRDSIITALQALAFDPGMGAETLCVLSERLGTRMDDEHDEEPGKVLHEFRRGEIAEVGLTPLTRYYGTVDATPLFLILVCEHVDWTGSLQLFRDLRPQIDQAVRWIDEYGDLDGDGLIEYLCRSSAGLVNQGWKDSWDGILDESGVPLEAPIALVEPQGYVVAAKRRIARLYEVEGHTERAESLRAEASRVARDIERFWLEDEGFYSMGMDRDKRPSRALASNQGHLLWSVAVPSERAAAIRDALMGPGSYSGWGVRTLGSEERGFNPVGYHTGTIWPHDNAIFALGLRKYGFDEAFLTIFENLLDAATSFPDFRLPELFAGFSRNDYEQPVPYPVACSPQAWAAGSLPSMLTAGLGLIPDALDGRLRIRRPSLPRHLNHVALNGVRIGDATVDLVFDRAGAGESVALTDVRIDGDIEVVLEVQSAHRLEVGPSIEQVTQEAGGG